jgi:hypothetical protein
MHLRRCGQAWQDSGGAATGEAGGNRPRSIRFGHSRIACRILSNRILCVVSGGMLRTALRTLLYRNQCVSKEVFDSTRVASVTW